MQRDHRAYTHDDGRRYHQRMSGNLADIAVHHAPSNPRLECFLDHGPCQASGEDIDPIDAPVRDIICRPLVHIASNRLVGVTSIIPIQINMRR